MRHVLWVGMMSVAALAACTEDTDLSAAACETGRGGPGDGLPDPPGSTSGGDHPLAATDPCAPVEITAPPPRPSAPHAVQCNVNWKDGRQTVWQSSTPFDDLGVAQKQCNAENGSDANCTQCTWANDVDAAAIYYCSGKVECDRLDQPFAAGCKYSNKRVNAPSMEEAILDVTQGCAEALLRRYGGEWGCRRGTLACTSGGDAPNGEGSVDLLPETPISRPN